MKPYRRYNPAGDTRDERLANRVEAEHGIFIFHSDHIEMMREQTTKMMDVVRKNEKLKPLEGLLKEACEHLQDAVPLGDHVYNRFCAKVEDYLRGLNQ